MTCHDPAHEHNLAHSTACLPPDLYSAPDSPVHLTASELHTLTNGNYGYDFHQDVTGRQHIRNRPGAPWRPVVIVEPIPRRLVNLQAPPAAGLGWGADLFEVAVRNAQVPGTASARRWPAAFPGDDAHLYR